MLRMQSRTMKIHIKMGGRPTLELFQDSNAFFTQKTVSSLRAYSKADLLSNYGVVKTAEAAFSTKSAR